MIALRATDPEMIPSIEAARMVGMHRSYLLNLARQGKIRSQRVKTARPPGYEVYVSADDVRHFWPGNVENGDEMTVSQAAHLLGITSQTVNAMIRDGKLSARVLPGTRWGHRYILKRAEVEKVSIQRRPGPGEVTVEDAALIAGVTQSTIRNAIRDRHLPARSLAHGYAVSIANVLLLWPIRERGLVTQAQAARLLGLTRQRVGQLMDKGALEEWRTPHGKRYAQIESIARCLDQGDAAHAP